MADGPKIAVVFTCSPDGMRGIMRFWEVMEELMVHDTINAKIEMHEPEHARPAGSPIIYVIQFRTDHDYLLYNIIYAKDASKFDTYTIREKCDG